LLVALKGGFDAPTSLIVEGHIGVITFFRTRFPAKAYQDEKKPESFPLSQRVAFSSHERRFD
jgi:hypothetical protein